MTDENAYALLFHPDFFITPPQKKTLICKKNCCYFSRLVGTFCSTCTVTVKVLWFVYLTSDLNLPSTFKLLIYIPAESATAFGRL